MTRQEALQRLEGTWAFQARGDRVVVRDLALLERIHQVQSERAVAGFRSRRLEQLMSEQAA